MRLHMQLAQFNLIILRTSQMNALDTFLNTFDRLVAGPQSTSKLEFIFNPPYIDN